MNHVSDLTVDTVMGFRPCGWDKEHDGKNYTRQRVEELFAGRATINILNVVEMDISDVDVIWLATRPGVLSERARLLWLASCAESVLENYQKFAPGDNRVEDCILAVRQFAWGQTDIQHLLSAHRAANNAAESAANSAYSAYSAAYSANRVADSANAGAYSTHSANNVYRVANSANSTHSAAYSAYCTRSAANGAYSAYSSERELQVLYLLDTLVELGEVEND